MRCAHLHSRNKAVILEDGYVGRVAFVRAVAIILLRFAVGVLSCDLVRSCDTLPLEDQPRTIFFDKQLRGFVKGRFTPAGTVGRLVAVLEVEHFHFSLC